MHPMAGHGMAYYISYALYLVFLTVNGGCKNTKQKQGTQSIINRLKIIYPGRKKGLIRKNTRMLTFQDNGY